MSELKLRPPKTLSQYFSVGLPFPAAELEGYLQAGGAEFVGEGAIEHGAGDDHAADAECGGGLRCGVARASICGCGVARASVLRGAAALEDADHRLEHRLEGALGGGAAAGNVSRQGDHGAGILHVVKMLARQISTNDLRAHVGGGEIDLHSFPATFPLGIGEEAAEDRGVEVALAFEIAVEGAVGEARAGHDLADGDAFEAVSIEQAARARDDFSLYCGGVSGGVGHACSSYCVIPSMGRSMRRNEYGIPAKYDLDHILAAWFDGAELDKLIREEQR
jgi:hypothetical protein